MNDLDLPNSRPNVGPSDSSDSASDLPPGESGTDSDSQGTGERESVRPFDPELDGADVDTDEIVDEAEAGISHARPDPVRNGRPD
ncbi:hypothetical protein CEG14_09130 [Bordetella genomosp. 1]|uniref:MatE family transporter n=1 Tax=Bordetella genomosp. 1 TaxID=1395607 RepID=A0A261SCX1_9BORD|nr:hypothetical protein [Bordetella genomosp. 1]MDQ8032885.1 hypothetical protein [Bordetella sp.]OZI35258.1 hypothetical protein CEG14_09130 [Bordetella genomosp. 1]OZI63801.1 hypothetical protein CAL27_14435 [Bordetella genomosp. 1]